MILNNHHEVSESITSHLGILRVILCHHNLMVRIPLLAGLVTRFSPEEGRMPDLNTRFRAALCTEFGPQPLAAALREVRDLVLQARGRSVPWENLATALSSVLAEANRPPISAATLRGMMRRMAAERTATADNSAHCPVTAETASQLSLLPSRDNGEKASHEPLGRIARIAESRAKISRIDKGEPSTD